MLDVGQGEGIYICDGNGHDYFVDGGSSDVSKVGEYRILPFLLCRGIKKIDGWFVSHCDEDHISGLLEIMESGYLIKRIYLYEKVTVDDALKNLLFTAEKCGIQVVYLDTGEGLKTKGVEFLCMNLPMDSGEKSADDKKNDNSLILKVQFGKEEFSALLAGDIGSGIEDELSDEWELEEIFIFKATHHGSKNSNGENILNEMKPGITMISCGEGNRYGHPHEEALQRIRNIKSRIYRTDENGQMTFIFKKNTVRYVRRKAMD